MLRWVDVMLILAEAAVNRPQQELYTVPDSKCICECVFVHSTTACMGVYSGCIKMKREKESCIVISL